MATIVFMPFHFASDLNPTFALARKLRDRGHHVQYLCIPDTEPRIRSQGFDFTPVFSQVAEFMDRFQGTLRTLREDELDRATRQLHPDLFLTSSGTPSVGLRLTRLVSRSSVSPVP